MALQHLSSPFTWDGDTRRTLSKLVVVVSLVVVLHGRTALSSEISINTTAQKVNNDTLDAASRLFKGKEGKEPVTKCLFDSQCSENLDGRGLCYKNRCVECIDGDAVCQSKAGTPYCSSEANKCVQCINDSQCLNGVCSNENKCVECMSNRQCAGRGSYIEFVCSLYASPPTYRYTCGECAVSTDCPYQMTCSSTNRTCTCTNDAQCGGDAPVCFEGRCQGCPGDGTPGDDFCSTSGLGSNCTQIDGTERFQCSECIDSSSCPFGMECVNRTCTCTTNLQCGGPDNQLANICSPTSNKCVQCVDSGDCSDTQRPYCVEGSCKECTGVDSSCPIRKPVTGNVQCSDYGTCLPFCSEDDECINGTEAGRCVECTDDSMCLNGFVCNPRTNMCSVCSKDSECPVETPICSDSRRTCIQCDENSGNCPSIAPICHNGMCKACVSDTDCPTHMFCSRENRCEMCLTDDHCAQVFGKSIKPFCSQDTYTCGNCKDDGDCPAQFPICSRTGGNANMCTQCNDTRPCVYGQTCSEQGICVECLAKGTVDRSCPPNRQFCSAQGQCVACLSSSDCAMPTESCFDGFCKECEGTASCSRVVEVLKTTCSDELTCVGTYKSG